MGFTQETIAKVSKEYFLSQFMEIYGYLKDMQNGYGFNKYPLESSLESWEIQKVKQEKLKRIPLIGQMLYRKKSSKSAKYIDSKERQKFVLSLMNNLGVERLDKYILKEIMENIDDFYDKYYREDYEHTFSSRLADYIANGLEK